MPLPRAIAMSVPEAAAEGSMSGPLTQGSRSAENRCVLRSVLAAWLVLAVVAPAAHAQGSVSMGAGGVGVGASAAVSCSDPEAGDVERPIGGDDTPPSYTASVTAEVSVPCGAQALTARGSASASGGFVSDRYGAIVEASGTAAASGTNHQESGGTAEFNQDFTVEGGPVDYQLDSEGNVRLDGFPGPSAGTLQPGFHTLQASVSSPGCPGACGTGGFSLTLQLGVPEDTDGDALYDVWETDGIDRDGDGTPELDLPAMGADPAHKDVFVEIDHMTGHGLSQTALDRVVDVFADAPVPNPDGDGGITLHIDNGPASRMDPATGAAWGAESDADELPHQAVLGTMAGRDYVWTAFDAIKAANLRPERADAFH